MLKFRTGKTSRISSALIFAQRFALCSAMLFSFDSCSHTKSDQNQAVAETVHRMWMFEDQLQVSWKYGYDLAEFQSIDDVVAHWHKLDFFKQQALRPETVTFDHWGEKFHWKVERVGSDLRATLTSSGRNRVFENGGGDDIMMVFTASKPGEKLETQLIIPKGIYEGY
ncbi:MAG TPA: hypothetical protein VKS79_15245 [Gemmataceae bacterium]|nr:hypothetical protein [Gemmataceae bacterium]